MADLPCVGSGPARAEPDSCADPGIEPAPPGTGTARLSNTIPAGLSARGRGTVPTPPGPHNSRTPPCAASVLRGIPAQGTSTQTARHGNPTWSEYRSAAPCAAPIMQVRNRSEQNPLTLAKIRLLLSGAALFTNCYQIALPAAR